MIIDCAEYVDGKRQDAQSLSVEEAARRRGRGGFVWIGLFEPAPAELERVRETFGLHALAVEDAQQFHLRPKVETYEGGVQLVILRTARYDDQREEIDFGEISVFVGVDFVITVRQGVASELRRRPSPARAAARTARSRRRRRAVGDPRSGRRRLRPVVAEVERDLEQVEATVFAGAVAPTQRIYFLRREVTNFYRAVHPLLGRRPRRSSAAPTAHLLPVLPRRA